MAGRSEKSERFGKNRKVDPRSFQARFGDLVRSARARKGFTQLDVALRVYGDETKASRVSDVERGRNKPQPDTINRYCEALSIAYEEVEALRSSVSDPAISQQFLIHRDIRPVPGFAGREDLLEAIEKALWQYGGTAALTNSDAHAAAVKGLGGVGKSVLAQQYAWRERERYHGVWWVRAETEQTLVDDLIDLGSRIMPNLQDVQDRDRALHLALDAIEGAGGDKPWLIVYDNVEKPGAIRKLRPREYTHILITSRWSDWQDEARELPVDVFAPKVAIDYLVAKRLHETREAAGDLAHRLGYLPLALSHARAYCAETNLSFDDYARRLSELIREAPEDAEYPRSVHATFNIALTRVVEACPEAEKLMAVAAFLSPERIPLNIFTEHEVSEKQRDKAVGALYKLSLLTYAVTETGAPAFTLHRLVQQVMRSYLRHD